MAEPGRSGAQPCSAHCHATPSTRGHKRNTPSSATSAARQPPAGPCHHGHTTTSSKTTTISGTMRRRWHYHYYDDGFAPYGAVLCGKCYTRASVLRRRASAAASSPHHTHDHQHRHHPSNCISPSTFLQPPPETKRIRTAQSCCAQTPNVMYDHALDGPTRRALKAQDNQSLATHAHLSHALTSLHSLAQTTPSTSTHPHASSPQTCASIASTRTRDIPHTPATQHYHLPDSLQHPAT